MATQPTNPQTFLDRDNWMRALLASDQPCAAVRLGIAIALHLNVKTGRCDPGHKTLKKDTGMSGETTRSVERWVAHLQRTGWLDIQRGGRKHTNSYVLIRPAKAVADQKRDMTRQQVADQTSFPDFDPPLSADDPPLSAPLTRHFQADDPPPVGGQKERTTKREKKGKRKTLRAARVERDDTPDSAPHGDLKKDAPAKEGTRAKARAVPAEAFERFWAVYPKRTGIDAARKAFDRVVADGADVDAVVARAVLYAVERKGEPPRFTLDPKNWLRDGKWKDPPPDGLVLDGESGEPVAIEQPEARGDQRGFVEIGEELARQIEENETEEDRQRWFGKYGPRPDDSLEQLNEALRIRGLRP
jgi:hypothetical protein